jgi:hypothetical protein
MQRACLRLPCGMTVQFKEKRSHNSIVFDLILVYVSVNFYLCCKRLSYMPTMSLKLLNMSCPLTGWIVQILLCLYMPIVFTLAFCLYMTGHFFAFNLYKQQKDLLAIILNMFLKTISANTSSIFTKCESYF